MYAKGEGIERDLAKAFEYFELAAANGHQRAIRVLSQAYEDGALGLQANPERATYWKNQLATESPDNE
jgi:localization factor PodJL